MYSGSFTISSSTTIYAYATAPGYSTSSTASRYCSYTAPLSNFPSSATLSVRNFTAEVQFANSDSASVEFVPMGSADFPSGTTYSGKLVNSTTGITLKTWSWRRIYNPAPTISIAVSAKRYDVLTLTITATCSGYNSKSASFTTTVGLA